MENVPTGSENVQLIAKCTWAWYLCTDIDLNFVLESSVVN